MSSTPTLSEFSPEHIDWQDKFIDHFYNRVDWTKGRHEFLLSGSYGSAKSMVAAHLGVRHCIENVGAVLLLGRKALPDLKDTIFKKIVEHLSGTLVKDRDYWVNESSARIRFRNGSQILSRSWSDKKYKKVRSLEISAAIIEEITENTEEDSEAYHEIVDRVGRISHIKESWVISCTNPDSPAHWVWKYFIGSPNSDTIQTFYSITADNPFLPDWYAAKIAEKYDAREIRRMLFGEWLELKTEVIYHQYDREKNYIDKSYVVNEMYPIILSWDFNIGKGKPLSMVLMQYVSGVFHVFNEVVVDGMRTEGSCEELRERGLLDYNTRYLIDGDATGKHRDTRSTLDDWEIIEEFLSNTRNKNGGRIQFQMIVQRSNPRIRARHINVNGVLCNSLGTRRLFVYKDAPTAHDGLSFSKLKKGAAFQEDDSYHAQHISTAIGYAICNQLDRDDNQDDATMVER